MFSDDQETVKTAPKKKRSISDPSANSAQPGTSRPRHSSTPAPRMSTGAPAPGAGGQHGVQPGGEDNCHILHSSYAIYMVLQQQVYLTLG